MQTIEYRTLLTRRSPKKSLTYGHHRRVGRNSQGRITVRHKGAGAKRLYRDIDFRYNKHDISARVISIEYDPNRSGFIGLVLYRDGEYRYHLMPSNVKPGDEFLVSENAPLKPGNRRPLNLIPTGYSVYNIEAHPGGGAKLARAAAARAEVLGGEGNHVQIKMPSGEVRFLHKNAWASIGNVSNEEHGFVTIGKAGRSRRMGIRPTVRGSAMNPVDHPYGGGEGKQPRGTRRPKNKWGKGVRGVKTRKKHKYSDGLILQRRKK